jgi:hypothetical protein
MLAFGKIAAIVHMEWIELDADVVLLALVVLDLQFFFGPIRCVKRDQPSLIRGQTTNMLPSNHVRVGYLGEPGKDVDTWSG